MALTLACISFQQDEVILEAMMEYLIITISLWLTATFDLPAAPNLPHVAQIPPQRIAAIHYGRAQTENSRAIVGAYDTRTGTIYLRHDWNPHSATDVSVLVHELVHHLQHHAAIRYPCREAREALAFEAQARWLDMFGQSLEEAFSIDSMTLKLRTQCLPH